MSNIEIASENKFLKQAINLKNSKKARKKQNKFLIEGTRLCKEALTNNVFIDTLFYTEQSKNKYDQIYNNLLKKSKRAYMLNNKLFCCLSDTKTPQGIACVCNMLDKKMCKDIIKNKSKIIALENIQDPSNLGTILRTADALNIDGVLLSKDCCDIYSPKVLRGSMGAIFRIPFFTADNFIYELNNFSSQGFKIYASVVEKNALSIKNVLFRNKSVVLIGNEANGLTEQSIDKSDFKITIPMNKLTESLNASAAANIIMWEMVK